MTAVVDSTAVHELRQWRQYVLELEELGFTRREAHNLANVRIRFAQVGESAQAR